MNEALRPRRDPAWGRLYNRRMNEKLFGELPAWLTQAGLAGTPDTDIFSGFCDRCAAAGFPLGRAHLFIDTLHPVHEGRLFRWGFGPDETALHDYGRTSVQGIDTSDPAYLDQQATDIWRRSPFFNMLQSGAALLRRRHCNHHGAQQTRASGALRQGHGAGALAAAARRSSSADRHARGPDPAAHGGFGEGVPAGERAIRP